MALSTITDARIWPLPATPTYGFMGPYKDGNDNLYVVAEDTNTADDLAVFKSTDNGSTWSRMDTVNQPNISNGLATWAVFQDGTTLHISAVSDQYAGGMDNFKDISYYTFHTSDAGGTADTWQISEAVVSTVSVQAVYGTDIAVRSDGDVIIHHPSAHGSMGSTYQKSAYSRREGGSWTTDILVSGGSNANNGYPWGITLGTNDSVHFHYWGQEGGAGQKGTTLDSANNLSGNEIGLDFSTSTNSVNGRPLSWDNNGTQQVLFVSRGGAHRCVEDGNGDVAFETGQTDGYPLNGDGNSFSSVAVVELNGEVIMHLRDTTFDLAESSSTQGDDADWADPTQIEDVTIDEEVICSRLYTRGGTDYIGIVLWDSDNTLLKFAEVVAVGGGGPSELIAELATESDVAFEVSMGDPGIPADLLGWTWWANRRVMHRIGTRLYCVQGESETGRGQPSEDGTVRNVPQMLGSTDNGVNWESFTDHTDNTNGVDSSNWFISARSDGSRYIGVVWTSKHDFSTADRIISYSCYDTVDHAWVVEAEAITDTQVAALGGDLVVRSDGEVVVSYVEWNAGQSRYELRYKKRPDMHGVTGFGSYTFVQEVPGSRPQMDVDPDDNIHITIHDNASPAKLHHVRIDATDTIGTYQTINAPGATPDGSSISPQELIIYHGWLYHMFVNDLPELYVRRAKLAEVPSWTTVQIEDVNGDRPKESGFDALAPTYTSAGMVEGDGQLIVAWAAETDDKIYWVQGPLFGNKFDSGSTVGTGVDGMLPFFAENQGDDRLHLYCINPGTDSGGNDAVTMVDIDLKHAAGPTGSTYGELIPLPILNFPFSEKSSQDFITEISESSTHPRRFYLFRQIDETGYKLHPWQSMDGLLWYNMNLGSNSDPQRSKGWERTSYDLSNELFHIVLHADSSNNATSDGDVNYWQFDPTTDTWVIEKEAVVTRIASQFAYQSGPAIGRSDGTVVCVYQVQASGTFTTGLDFKIRSSGGTWGSPNTFVANRSVSFQDVSGCLGTSDRVHVVFRDPDVQHRSLNSSDVLDTENLVFDRTAIIADTAGTAILLNGSDIGVLYARDDRLRAFKTATSGANPSWSSQKNVDDSAASQLHTTLDRDVVNALFVADTNFFTGMPRGSSPYDIYTDEYINNSWGTDADTGEDTVASIDKFYGNTAYQENGQDYLLIVGEVSSDYIAPYDTSGVQARIHRIPVSVTPPGTLLAELATESDVAFEVFIGYEGELLAELATESDIAFEVVLEADESIFDAELATESDAAFEVVLEADDPSLDASTDIIVQANIADTADTVPPTPLTGLGKVARGDHRTKVYQRTRNVLRKR